MRDSEREYFSRKIQKFSKYSYAVTLPSNWIKKYGIEKEGNNLSKNWKEEINPTVRIYEMPDGHLEIYLKQNDLENDDESLSIINLDEYLDNNENFIEEKTIQMILISYYMNGSKGLEIISKKPIPNVIINQIENTQTKLLFNWNMSKISSRKILVKNVFKERAEDIFHEQIPRFLRESFAVILGILEDFITALETKDFHLLKTIPERDNKIDRYYFFTVRQIRTVFERPKLTKPLNYSHKKLVDLRLLAKYIEDVGDLFKDTSNIMINISNFLEEILLYQHLLDYFKILYRSYSLLADELRISLTRQMTTVGMNESIMALIEEFREEGRILEKQWDERIKNIQIAPLIANYEFSDFFQGSALVKNLEEIYKKIFDFTNLFF